MPPQVATVGAGSSPQEWYASLPLVTKTFFTALVLSAASVQFGVLDPQKLLFSWPHIWQQFEIWRLVTPFAFAGGFGLPFAMHTYMMYNNCMSYEADPFNTGAGGSSADFIWMIILSMTQLGVFAYFNGDRILSPQLMYTIVYVQSRRSPESVRSMFGFRFQNAYTPWLYVAINVLMGNPIMPCILGIIVGHVYFHFVDTVPKTSGFDIITTPRFCEDIARLGGDPLAAARAPETGFRATGAGSHWGRAGRGRQLGSR